MFCFLDFRVILQNLMIPRDLQTIKRFTKGTENEGS